MRLVRLVGGGAEWGAGAGLENLGTKARASDLVLWAVGAPARFYAGERLVRLASNAHKLCCVTLNKCLLSSIKQGSWACLS